VWGPDYTEQIEYLWVYIGRLRNRLEDDPNHPRLIETVAGAGYRFQKLDPACDPLRRSHRIHRRADFPRGKGQDFG